VWCKGICWSLGQVWWKCNEGSGSNGVNAGRGGCVLIKVAVLRSG
jgi:hypothetical protein